MISEETAHTVKVGNRILHKKDVAEVPEMVVNNLFQQSKPEELAQTKKKEIFTGTGGRFVSKDTKGAKSTAVDIISPDTKLKRAEEKSQKLRQMIAENQAKKSAHNRDGTQEAIETTENQQSATQLSVKTPENSKRKGKASGKKAMSEVNPTDKTPPQIQSEMTTPQNSRYQLPCISTWERNKTR